MNNIIKKDFSLDDIKIKWEDPFIPKDFPIFLDFFLKDRIKRK